MYHPDIFWFDVGGKLPFSEQLRIVQAVRAADPNVVINGRAARAKGATGATTSIRPTTRWKCAKPREIGKRFRR